MAQWLKICLSVQGTQVRPLIQEDCTSHRATKPVRHNYCAGALSLCPATRGAHTPQPEKAFAQKWRLRVATKTKKIEVRRAYYIWPKTANY